MSLLLSAWRHQPEHFLPDITRKHLKGHDQALVAVVDIINAHYRSDPGLRGPRPLRLCSISTRGVGAGEDNLRGVQDSRRLRHSWALRRLIRRREESREHIDRGMLARREPLGRFLLHL